VFAWAQNRHIITGWYGVGTALQSFVEVRGAQGEKLLSRMFKESRLFRLIIDEVEKTLAYVDLGIAREYAGLVPDPGVREAIFGMIEEEHRRTVAAVLRVSGGRAVADRFPQFRRRLERRLPILNHLNGQQIELLRRVREGPAELRERNLTALLLSMNGIASGFGSTG
jgi:phosphoenolpyruvate carboxylase